MTVYKFSLCNPIDFINSMCILFKGQADSSRGRGNFSSYQKRCSNCNWLEFDKKTLFTPCFAQWVAVTSNWMLKLKYYIWIIWPSKIFYILTYLLTWNQWIYMTILNSTYVCTSVCIGRRMLSRLPCRVTSH